MSVGHGKSIFLPPIKVDKHGTVHLNQTSFSPKTNKAAKIKKNKDKGIIKSERNLEQEFDENDEGEQI